MGYYGYKPYVPVAERREQAQKKMMKLAKNGLQIQPVKLASKKIGLTFWGKAWCDHIEAFHDQANRLERGRTYVRNGSVCHLAIEPGEIKAFVSGSELYTVHIRMRLLNATRWQGMQQICRGQVGSLLDLLGGRLPPAVMQVVCDPQKGLFPSASEVELSCTCLDWATMCKHVAAVLYGVGARLDSAPSELFKLRGVDHTALVDVVRVITEVTQTSTNRRRVVDNDLSALFDIDMKTDMPAETSTNIKPVNYSGNKIKKIRLKLQQTQQVFAKTLAVSASTVSKWEASRAKRVTLKSKQVAILQEIVSKL